MPEKIVAPGAPTSLTLGWMAIAIWNVPAALAVMSDGTT